MKKLLAIITGVLFTTTIPYALESDGAFSINKGNVKIEKIEKGDMGPLSVPLKLNYQGYLTDNSGNAINDTLTMVFRIFDAQAGGNQLWTSGNQQIIVSSGVFHYILSNVPLSIFLPGEPRYLELTVEGQILTPRTEVTSAPWSYTATFSDTAGGTARIGGRPVSNAAPAVNQVLKWDGTQWKPANDTSVADNDWIISGNNMYSGVTGNVGIGTMNPRTKFEVRDGNITMSGSPAASDTVYSGISQEVNNRLVNFGVNSGREGPFNPNYLGYWFRCDTRSGSQGFHFFRRDAGNPVGTELVTISDSGNVGIGTSTPQSKLHVVGDLKVEGKINGTKVYKGGLSSGATLEFTVPNGATIEIILTDANDNYAGTWSGHYYNQYFCGTYIDNNGTSGKSQAHSIITQIFLDVGNRGVAETFGQVGKFRLRCINSWLEYTVRITE